MRLTKKVSFDEEINLDPSRPASLFASTVSPIVPFQKRPEAGGPEQDAFENLEISRSGSEQSIVDTRPSSPEVSSFDTAIKIREGSATIRD